MIYITPPPDFLEDCKSMIERKAFAHRIRHGRFSFCVDTAIGTTGAQAMASPKRMFSAPVTILNAGTFNQKIGGRLCLLYADGGKNVRLVTGQNSGQKLE